MPANNSIADAPPCDRCKAAGRSDLCEFPPPGTSALHRRPKRPRHEDDAPTPTASYRPASGTDRTAAPAQSPLSPAATASLLDALDPFDLLTDEVKNSYLRCSYKWSFHHTPDLLLRIRDRSLEPWMVWAMLALAIRYAQPPPICLVSFTDVSPASSRNRRRPLLPRLRLAMPSPPMPARCSRPTSRHPA